MAKHVLNRARSTTWEIRESDDIWILGERGRIAGAAADMLGISASSYVDKATIRIDGEIDLTGNGSYGASLGVENAIVAIGKSGRVSADQTAISCSSIYSNGKYIGTAAIDNRGFLEGRCGINVSGAQDGIRIDNSGRIHADLGISVLGTGARIVNSGIIKAETGIEAVSEGGDDDPLEGDNATTIVNTGKITGSDASILVDLGADVAVNIRNRGLLDGDVIMGDGDDVFNTLGGRLNGILYGGDGDDVVTLSSLSTVYVEYANEGTDTVRINGSYQLGANIENLTLLGKGNHTGIGNSLHNTITGNKGDNVLYGQAGGDVLKGGAGNDRLDGGSSGDDIDGGRGNDILTGGEGGDAFIFEPGYGRDTITDFEQGSDVIELYGFGNFAAIDGKIEYSGGDAVIDLGGGDVIVILDVQANSLSDTNFLFYN